MSKLVLNLVITLVLAAGTSGCAGILSVPSLEEQAALLREAGFTPETRYAVVSRKTNLNTSMVFPIGDLIAPPIARTASERLGINAVALPHASGSPWSIELQRAEQDTGWVTTTNSDDFFRAAGFDGYVLITVNEGMEYYDYPKEPGSGHLFFHYNPVFHIFALPKDSESALLMQEGQSGAFSCEVVDHKFKNESRCVDTFVKRFRRALDARLSLYESKVF